MILLAGTDRAGSEQVVDVLHEWMDARYLDTWFSGSGTAEETERPMFWRFWRLLPPNGRVGMFVGAWIHAAVAARIRGDLNKRDYKRKIKYIHSFERMLSADGNVMLKFWLHVPAKILKSRLKKAHLDADTAMYMEELDQRIYENYEKAQPVIDRAISDTMKVLPWQIIDGTDERQRNLTVAKTVLAAIRERLDEGPAARPREGRRRKAPVEVPNHLGGVDLSATLPYKKYVKTLEDLQLRLHDLSLEARRKKLATVLVFEGWDAAGKGGVIRRITKAISARDAKVIPIGVPTDEELAHHYLWRFWRRLPRDGQMRIFDRSWYGRVLVERIERLATELEWSRAYEEINEFEAQIIGHGTPVLKFWLHIDPDEQLRRFQAREKTDYKKYKITDEDYRNREKWSEYVDAVNEMVERTSTKQAPWHLVPANDKRWARTQVARTVCETLESSL